MKKEQVWEVIKHMNSTTLEELQNDLLQMYDAFTAGDILTKAVNNCMVILVNNSTIIINDLWDNPICNKEVI